jgi:hypothetical protein
MKKIYKTVSKVYIWLIYIEDIAILVSGHPPSCYNSFLNPVGHADLTQPP